MSRCRCCNKALSDAELRATNPFTMQPEDFCGICLKAARGMVPKVDYETDHVREALSLNDNTHFDVESELDIETRFT